MADEEQGIKNSQEIAQQTDWPKVAIIVLNWNGWRDTIECLESLQKITYPNYEIIVVDNGSTDDSLEKIKAWARGDIPVRSEFLKYDPMAKPVKWAEFDRIVAETAESPEKKVKIAQLPSNRGMVLIQTRENLGFAGGNNVGMRYALNEGMNHILVLNNDVIVDKSFLEPLVGSIQNEGAGIVGPAVYSYSEPNRLVSTGMRINYWKGKGINIAYRRVDFLTGCCLLIKKDVIKEISYFHEPYFLNFEETEYCLRAKGANFGIIYESRSKIWHKIHAALDKVSFAYYYSYRNKLLFTKRNAPFYVKYPFYIYYSLYLILKLIVKIVIGDITVALSIKNALFDFWKGNFGKGSQINIHGKYLNRWRF